jgi:hypothetical protein
MKNIPFSLHMITVSTNIYYSAYLHIVTKKLLVTQLHGGIIATAQFQVCCAQLLALNHL